jgi:5-methylcytosine-specific restriction endonuclease McrA
MRARIRHIRKVMASPTADPNFLHIGGQASCERRPTSQADAGGAVSEWQPIITRAQAIERGLKRFYSGFPCCNGHECEQYISGKCVECQRLSNRRQARLRKSRRYYQKNRAKALERGKRWKAANKEKCREHAARFYAENPIARAMYENRRRARKLGNGGRYTAADVRSLYVRQLGKCAYHSYCGTKLDDDFHIDHKIPISRGGSNGIANIQLLCAPCNLSKSDSHPHEFEQRLKSRSAADFFP